MRAAGAGRRAEAQHVEEAVREAEDGAFVEVEAVAPAEGVVGECVRDQRGEVDACARLDGAQDGGAGEGDHGGPVLGCGWGDTRLV